MTFFCACGNDEPYRLPLDEFEPIKIRFKFVDKDGSDLLDPSNPKNVLDSCYARFKEVVYKPDQSFEINPNDEKSKVNFQGLRLVKLEDKYAMEFGELDGSYYYKNDFFDIVFVHKVYSLKIYSIWTWGDDGMPQFIREYTRGEYIIASNTATPTIELEKLYLNGSFGE